MSFYRGYNTVDTVFGSTRLEDKELIKRDLLNHFQIRKGEKLMRPDFGTIIWDHIYDPMTEDVKQSIVDDVTTIVNSDPRTQVSNVILTEYELGLQVEVELFYRELDLSEELLLQFNGETQQISTSIL